MKPILYAFNTDEIDYVLDREELIQNTIPEILRKVEYYDPTNDPWTVVSARLETELCKHSTEEGKKEYLRNVIGVDDVEPVMGSLSHNVLPNIAMELLNMGRAYTGPGVPSERSKTTRAHLFTKGLTAEGLAGRIHGKIEKGFIHAEVCSATLLLDNTNYVGAKESGNIRMEGRDYKLAQNDVVFIKWK